MPNFPDLRSARMLCQQLDIVLENESLITADNYSVKDLELFCDDATAAMSTLSSALFNLLHDINFRKPRRTSPDPDPNPDNEPDNCIAFPRQKSN